MPEVSQSDTRFVGQKAPRWRPVFLIVVAVICLGLGLLSYRLWSPGGQVANSPSVRLVGGVAPHHLLVDERIVDFIRHLADSRPEPPPGVIILLPNHHERGGPQLVIPETDAAFWATAGAQLAWRPDDQIIAGEEAVATWATLRRQADVDWRVYPVLVSLSSSPEQIAGLTDTVISLIDQGYFLIASVDFSHYRAARDAEIFDARTRSLLTAGDVETIWYLGNDYVDSGKILSIAARLVRDGQVSLEWVWHGNSAALTPTVDDGNTTSYHIINFYRSINP